MVEITTTDESGDRTHTKFPGVETGVLDGDLLRVGVGVASETDGGDAREEGDQEQTREDKVKFHRKLQIRK
jgi:hypothetical protein